MNIVDLLVTIVVVTILVTIVLAIATYVAYKLRLAREPSGSGEPEGPKYFVLYRPERPVIDAGELPAVESVHGDDRELQPHATQA